MDAWRRTLSQFRDLVNGLAPRQRMTLAAAPLLVLAVLGLVMSSGAALREDAVLAGKTFSAEEIRNAREAFRQAGLTESRVEGTRIFAPQSAIGRYNAVLSAKAADTGASADNLERAVGANSLFMGSGQRQELIDLARNREVAEMIRKLPQIEEAQIVGHRSRRAGFSGETKMTATLSVTPRQGIELTNELYRSLQRIVGGAMSMADSDVTILNTRTGETIRYPEQDRWLAQGAAGPESGARSSPVSSPPDQPKIGWAASGSDARQNPNHNVAMATPAVMASKDRPRSRKSSASWQGWKWADVNAPELAGPVGGALLSICLLWGMGRLRMRRRSTAEVVIPSETALLDAPLESGSLAAAPRPPDNAVPSLELPAAEREVEPDGDVQRPADVTTQSAEESAAAPVGDAPVPPAAVVFEFLHHTPPEYVLSFVTEEHPQTIALILSHLPAPLASRVLRGLPTTKQLDVVRRVAALEETSAEVLEDVARSLRGRIATFSPDKDAFGRRALAPGAGFHLPGTNRPLSRALRDNPPGDDNDFAERLRRLMFVFDDLLKLTDSTIAAVFSRVDTTTWALALKGASEELRSKIIDHISPTAADRLHLELQDLGPVRVRDVAAAQQQIVEMVRRMEDAGEIVGVDDDADALRMIA
ncbi:MAG TPA: FliG C-terminal domain-containing protein [Planctomycetaceae bacterium]|nr:FliG C-terminal domain-containing protein [Planctomycetaceae bacterium]